MILVQVGPKDRARLLVLDRVKEVERVTEGNVVLSISSLNVLTIFWPPFSSIVR